MTSSSAASSGVHKLKFRRPNHSSPGSSGSGYDSTGGNMGKGVRGVSDPKDCTRPTKDPPIQGLVSLGNGMYRVQDVVQGGQSNSNKGKQVQKGSEKTRGRPARNCKKVVYAESSGEEEEDDQGEEEDDSEDMEQTDEAEEAEDEEIQVLPKVKYEKNVAKKRGKGKDVRAGAPWSDDEFEKLLDIVIKDELSHSMTGKGQFRRQSRRWENIYQEFVQVAGSSRNCSQVNKKFDNMLAAFKKVLNYNNKTGRPPDAYWSMSGPELKKEIAARTLPRNFDKNVYYKMLPIFGVKAGATGAGATDADEAEEEALRALEERERVGGGHGERRQQSPKSEHDTSAAEESAGSGRRRKKSRVEASSPSKLLELTVERQIEGLKGIEEAKLLASKISMDRLLALEEKRIAKSSDAMLALVSAIGSFGAGIQQLAQLMSVQPSYFPQQPAPPQSMPPTNPPIFQGHTGPSAQPQPIPPHAQMAARTPMQVPAAPHATNMTSPECTPQPSVVDNPPQSPVPSIPPDTKKGNIDEEEQQPDPDAQEDDFVDIAGVNTGLDNIQ